jgi:hypothetical protein
MCGASAQQNQLASEEATAYQQATAMTATQYAAQQAIYAPMAAQFNSIFAKGPNQEGFSGSEVQDLNAQAINGTAQNYSQAAKAVGESTAAEGGGTNPLPTGAQTELKEEVANSAAATESGEEEQIKQADYSQGYNEWQNAAAGLSGIATGEDPLGYENAATGSAGAANSEANAVEEANDSWINAAIGAAGSIGGGLATGGMCPAKGTLYLLDDGISKPVEELRAGDLLRGLDHGLQRIEMIQIGRAAVVKVTTDSGCELRCSEAHSFPMPQGGYTVAAKAQGRMVITMNGAARILNMEPDGEDEVYNVVTDGSHTYRANGIWSLGMDAMEVRQ